MDRRRITGPENAIPLVFATEKSEHFPADQNNKGPRKFYAKQAVVDNANGSCYLEVDSTTIIVSVYGAKPIKGSSITSASFSVTTRVSGNVNELPEYSDYSGSSDKFLTTTPIGRTQLSSIEQRISSYIHSAFLPSILVEKYPKSSIEVVVNVLSNDTNTNHSELSLLTWASNCTTLALVDSGIELLDMVSTGSARIYNEDVEVDPLFAEGAGYTGDLCVVSSYMNGCNKLVGMVVEGSVGMDRLGKAMKGCEEMAKSIRGNMDGLLIEVS